MTIRSGLAASALLLAPAALYAQETPEKLRDMQADRPNETNSPTTIDAGHLQLEIGAIDTGVERDGGERDRQWSLGEMNFRLGVLDRLEVNVIVSPRLVEAQRADGVETRARGFGDLIVGGKFNIWGNDGGKTALAIQPQVKLPTASTALGNGHVEATVALPFTAQLPAGFGLSLQPMLTRERNDANTATLTGYEGAAAIDHHLGPLDLYGEYVEHGTTGHHAVNRHLLDLGGTAQVARNLVLDTGVSIGLNRAAQDFEITTGGSVRF